MADEQSCPATGTMGIHSDAYYDEGRCIWCGAERPSWGIYRCPNCGVYAKVTLDQDGLPVSYGHITFDRIEGIDFERFTCTKKKETE